MAIVYLTKAQIDALHKLSQEAAIGVEIKSDALAHSPAVFHAVLRDRQDAVAIAYVADDTDGDVAWEV